MPISAPLLNARRQLVQQFQVLSVPNACYLRLYYWIKIGQGAGTTLDRLPIEMDQYVKSMFDLIWRWVTTPHTEEELLALLSMEYCCSPEERQAPDHPSRDQLRAGTVETSSNWEVVIACIHIGSLAKMVDVVPLNKLHRRKLWPRSVESYLPHGAARTIQGLCQWFKHEPLDRSRMFLCVTKMICIFRPLVASHLIVSRPFLDAVYHMRQTTELYMIQHSTPLEKTE
jgi:hypothetical protein